MTTALFTHYLELFAAADLAGKVFAWLQEAWVAAGRASDDKPKRCWIRVPAPHVTRPTDDVRSASTILLKSAARGDTRARSMDALDDGLARSGAGQFFQPGDSLLQGVGVAHALGGHREDFLIIGAPVLLIRQEELLVQLLARADTSVDDLDIAPGFKPH